MRLGRGQSGRPDFHDDSDGKVVLSEKGRVKVGCELGSWLPCPQVFSPKHDAGSWSRLASTMWWGTSGLPHDDNAVEQLAAVFRSTRETAQGIHGAVCWMYLRDLADSPLPVYVRACRQEGERDRRLRLLAGADDGKSVRKPQVAKFATGNLGTGLRVARYRTPDDRGTLACILSYAFRVEGHETDVQVFTSSIDLRALTAAGDDIERFIQSITVHSKTE
jgi:hypothetical protein